MTEHSTSANTKKNRDNNELISFRLGLVEIAINTLTTRFDKQDNIKRSDLIEFRDTIVSRISDVNSNLQKQIDGKADKQEFKDFKKQMAGIGALVAALLVATYSYILTRLH